MQSYHHCSLALKRELQSTMVSVDAANTRLQDAINASSAMSLRDLPDHICVGPMPPGSITVNELPLRDLDPKSTGLKHVFDLVLDISSKTFDWDHIKAIVRNGAWHELPTWMQFKERPSFDTVVQYFLLPQSDGKVCLLKHIYVVADKVKGSCIETFVHGKGYELLWGSANKKLAR